ncbi:MAG: hypothetical protein L3J41_09890 [Melioribacteraceae bacterium]|nr:hypothetical protein [Melioribacteraceae bacterium]
MDKNLDDKIEENQSFWKTFDDNLEDTLDLIEDEESNEESYFLDNKEYTGNDFNIKRLIAESQEASQLAKEYINIVSEWFEKNKVIMNKEISVSKLNDSLEVIEWYHIFIYPKIMRAIQGRDEDLLESEFPKDSDGSAKIVLIAIEHSISAWGYIFMKRDDKNETVFNIIKLLVTLQNLVEEEFPAARDFIRPGFDE